MTEPKEKRAKIQIILILLFLIFGPILVITISHVVLDAYLPSEIKNQIPRLKESPNSPHPIEGGE